MKGKGKNKKKNVESIPQINQIIPNVVNFDDSKAISNQVMNNNNNNFNKEIVESENKFYLFNPNNSIQFKLKEKTIFNSEYNKINTVLKNSKFSEYNNIINKNFDHFILDSIIHNLPYEEMEEMDCLVSITSFDDGKTNTDVIITNSENFYDFNQENEANWAYSKYIKIKLSTITKDENKNKDKNKDKENSDNIENKKNKEDIKSKVNEVSKKQESFDYLDNYFEDMKLDVLDVDDSLFKNLVNVNNGNYNDKVNLESKYNKEFHKTVLFSLSEKLV